MRSSVAQLVLAAATLAVLTTSGSAVAQSPEERSPSRPREVLVNRNENSETDFRLGDHQKLRSYFLDGSRDPFR